MNTYYLDSQSWINLAHAPEERALVVQAASRNVIRIKAGWVVLDETVNEGLKDWTRYSDFMEDLWKIVRGKVLAEANLRMAMEFIRNAPLLESQMYIPFMGEKGIIGAINDFIVREAADGIREDKLKNKGSLSKVREGVLAYYKERNISPSSPEWHEMEKNLPAYAQDYANSFWRRTIEGKKFEELSTFSSYFYCELERLRLMAKEGRSHKRLGHWDMLVFVDARSSKCDFLVTDDAGLIEVTNNLQERLSSGPKAIMHSEFIAFLGR